MDTFHPSLWAALFGWLIAQSIKMALCLIQTGRLDIGYLVSTGGMPSAHSAMVGALSTAIGIAEGFDSAIFALAVAFALIVMFDAQSVRKAAGEQAQLLNQIVNELLNEHHLSERKLKELLGHTQLEVSMGALTGITTAIVTLRFIL